MLHHRVRDYLCLVALTKAPITYQALAKALALRPPNTILQLTEALEHLIHEDASAGRPLIAALVISKARGGLPALGFFECAQRAGVFHGDVAGAQATAFYETERDRAIGFWRSAPTD